MDEHRTDGGESASEDEVDRIQRAWQQERPGTPVDSIGVVARIKWIAKLLDDEHRRVVRPIGIDAAIRDLLSTLRRSGPPYRLSSGELARLALLSTGAISQRIARAEQRGLVRREKSATDGRGVMVELTPAGHHLIEETIDEIIRHERQLLSGLTTRQRDQLGDLLRVLLTDLTRRRGGQDRT